MLTEGWDANNVSHVLRVRAFAEFTDGYEMQADFESKVETTFDEMIGRFQPGEGTAK